MSDNHTRQIEKLLNDAEKEQEKRKIDQDLWKQLKEVSIAWFKGDKNVYEQWKGVFASFTYKTLATAQYKLLRH